MRLGLLASNRLLRGQPDEHRQLCRLWPSPRRLVADRPPDLLDALPRGWLEDRESDDPDGI